MNDFIIWAIISAILIGAIGYIVIQKRKGVKCIGCVAGAACACTSVPGSDCHCQAENANPCNCTSTSNSTCACTK